MRFDLPMYTTAFKAKYISKTNTGPLRIFHSAITADRVTRNCLDNRLVGRGHLHHLEGRCPDRSGLRMKSKDGVSDISAKQVVLAVLPQSTKQES